MPDSERGIITRQFVYVAKSMRGIESSNLSVTERGVALPIGDKKIGDREFMFVWTNPDGDNVHHFLTQRGSVSEGSGDTRDRGQTLSKLARIQPVVDQDRLFLTADNFNRLELPIEPEDGERLTVQIHKKNFAGAVAMGTEYDQWGSDFVGAPVRLVRAVNGVLDRPVSSEYLRNRTQIGFQDGYQIHVIPEEGVTQLRNRMFEYVSRYERGELRRRTPITYEDIPGWEDLMRAFRPNMVVKGIPLENFYQIWKAKVGDIVCAHPKPCDRCTMPKVNQFSGDINKIDPVAVLSEYMTWKNKDGDPRTIFGINLLPYGEGQTNNGDPFQITHIRRGSNRIVYGPMEKRAI